MGNERISASPIPRDQLQKILFKRIHSKNVEHYKNMARFYLQCQRFEEANRFSTIW